MYLNFLRTTPDAAGPRFPRLRPWAMAVPVLVLLVSLPLLRPLRHPDPRRISDDETARLATVQAIVEHGTLAIDATDFTTTARKIERRDRAGEPRWYADQPPMMSALLAGPYWAMRRAGLSLGQDQWIVAYLLTVLGVTLPVAGAAGLVYRMGRLFELRRPWRAALSGATVFGTGLISYATVLNPHAPAAALLLASAACLVQVATRKVRWAAPFWLMLSGGAAALAATLDPSAVPFLFLFLLAIVALHWRIVSRAGGLLAYAAGACIPIVAHAALTLPATGDFWQGSGGSGGVGGGGVGMWRADDPNRFSALSPVTTHPLRPAPPRASSGPVAVPILSENETTNLRTDVLDKLPAAWDSGRAIAARLADAMLGDHGLLTHFPVLLMGVLGMTMIMRRHWPSSAKLLAGGTMAGAVFLIVAYAAHRPPAAPAAAAWRDAMFGARWFVVFGPLVLFWSGAWLRKSHRPMSWVAAGVLLAFSVAVSLIGATGPLPREGFVRDGTDRYTAAEALSRLVRPAPAVPDVPQVAAGR